MSLFSKLTGIKAHDKKKSESANTEAIEENFFPDDSVHEIVTNDARIEKKTNPKEKKTHKIKSELEKDDKNPNWSGSCEEGELLIDVFQDNNNIIIKSTIAGVKPENIDISINNDMLTIRGERHDEEIIDENNYFYRECYWGNFSRTIILPQEVKHDKITAALKNGVLTIKLPKAKQEKKVAIKVVSEEN